MDAQRQHPRKTRVCASPVYAIGRTVKNLTGKTGFCRRLLSLPDCPDHAAVHRNARASDVAGRIGEQECADLAKLLDGAVAFPRQGSLAVCPLRLRGDALLLGLKGIGGTDPVGVHASGHEVVDPDVVWREL